MFRMLLSGVLALAVVAEAAAQTAPTTKTATTTRKSGARPAAKAAAPARAATTTRAAAANTTAAAGGRNDIGPGGNGAVGSTESADGKGQSIYAAPGMPVNVDNPKKVGKYDGPAPVRTKSRTTLTPR
ncbi:hypothetical protein MUN81_03015 [Hymenobacter sp. 5317J-9]|uniref:hypothetical protein n=1 Tax=Hymenobacter sp. 5317J-9 TaxID=2932250 RepID=UPI001FD708F1|nr:hypothetical protein [Hymenobacter sp. 5317J-9]UOQ98466.1 hypothetical protein MUN81_03015 [Hymenobacter sp. 5317J-9]